MAVSVADAWEQARAIQATAQLLRRHIDPHLHRPGEGPGKDLSPQQLTALSVIKEKEPITIKALSEILMVSPPSASVMVDRLVEMGLLTRAQSRQDRREVQIRVSPDVYERLEQAEKRSLQSIVEVLTKIGPEYAVMWCDVSDKVRQVLAEKGSSSQ
ncbi:MAG TPA: MarR family transcriptional regulator [Candidatus Hydrogenedentes bacterium]|nr:MarR family transcriptional regulator [Candidatus Hydrogenedentota bacterium]